MAMPQKTVFFCALMLILAGCLGEPATLPPQNATADDQGQQTQASQPQVTEPAPELPAKPSPDTPGLLSPRPLPVPCPMMGEGITCAGNLQYANDSEFQVLDIYTPEFAKGPYPLIIHVHGGSWAIGSKDAGPAYFLDEGYALAEVEYRLSDEAGFPAQIEDVKAAIRWLRANAGAYNLDPGRFGAIGESAGGHLAALAGTSGNSAEFGGEAEVQAVADLFGPIDFNSVAGIPEGERYGDYTSAAAKLIGGEIGENPEIVAQASPLTYIDANDPPFLIIHGTDDDTVPYNESLGLYLALQKANVNATLITVDGGGHGGFDESQGINAKVKEFFGAALRQNQS